MFVFFIATLVFSVLTALLTTQAKPGTLKDFTFPQIGDGDPLIYAFGRVKIEASGMVWYGDFHARHPPFNSLGFLSPLVAFMSLTSTVYRYYLGWQLVICIGPDAKLLRV